MGAEDSTNPPASLHFEFADPGTGLAKGEAITLDAESCRIPPKEAIPKLSRKISNFLPDNMGFGQLNPDYYREFAVYEAYRRLYQPVRFVIRNAGPVAARSVRVELSISRDQSAQPIKRRDLPNQPIPTKQTISDRIAEFAPRALGDPGALTVSSKRGEAHQILIEFGNIQPGRDLPSEGFFIGAVQGVKIEGKVFADNLPEPLPVSLSLEVRLRQTELSVQDIIGMCQWVPQVGERYFTFGEVDDPIQSIPWVNDGSDHERRRLNRVFKTKYAAEQAKYETFADMVQIRQASPPRDLY